MVETSRTDGKMEDLGIILVGMESCELFAKRNGQDAAVRFAGIGVSPPSNGAFETSETLSRLEYRTEKATELRREQVNNTRVNFRAQ